MTSDTHTRHARLVGKDKTLAVEGLKWCPPNGKFNSVGKWLVGTVRMSPAWAHASSRCGCWRGCRKVSNS